MAASPHQTGIARGGDLVRTMLRATLVGSVMCVGAAVPAHAQLKAAGTIPIVYGHHHINTPDIAGQERFWIEGMGGVSFKLGTSPSDRIKFTNVIVQLTPGKISGGSGGSTADHLAFFVEKMDPLIAHLKGMGYSAEPMKAEGQPGVFVMAPDNVKVYLFERAGVGSLPAFDHVHLMVPDVDAARAWYQKYFSLTTLPVGAVLFTHSPAPLAPSKGRALDHVGFEAIG